MDGGSNPGWWYYQFTLQFCSGKATSNIEDNTRITGKIAISDGHSSKYHWSPIMLNFSYQTRTGVINMTLQHIVNMKDFKLFIDSTTYRNKKKTSPKYYLIN